jgi:hypothetical protein
MMTIRFRFTHLPIVLICMLYSLGCEHRESAVSATVPPKGVPVASTTSPILASVVPATPPSSGASSLGAPVSVPANAAKNALTTYHCPTAELQFEYPADWKTKKAHTALFSITSDQCSLNLDIPKLPWHPPGMITLKMVASGYEDDLKSTQMPDAVEEEDTVVEIPSAKACRITTCGHANGQSACDIAVIMIHADRVYILSTDCNDSSKEKARKALDEAVSTLKWAN